MSAATLTVILSRAVPHPPDFLPPATPTAFPRQSPAARAAAEALRHFCYNPPALFGAKNTNVQEALLGLVASRGVGIWTI